MTHSSEPAADDADFVEASLEAVAAVDGRLRTLDLGPAPLPCMTPFAVEDSR